MITKMVLVPAESQTGGALDESEKVNENVAEMPLETRPKRIERSPDKIRKLLKIALKIARSNAYNEDFQIKDFKGMPISESDITALLNSAISSQKKLVGEEDFIRILYESKVDPTWIVNENMRSKLLNYRPKVSIERADKRKSDTPVIEQSKKPKNAWEIPLPDDEWDT